MATPFEIEVRTRFGKLVRADVYLPQGARGPFPVIFAAAPYLKSLKRFPSHPAFASFGLSFEALRVAVFGTVLLGIAITDAKHYVIPDGFTVFGLVWLLGTAFVGAWFGDTRTFAGPYDALIGACAGAGAIAIAGWLGEVALKREAMGFGDVTLMAMVGAALGPGRALLTVFVGALLGAVVFIAVVLPVAWLRRGRAAAEGDQLALPLAEPPAFEPPLVPFGVFLAPAALLTLLWGYAMVARYLEWISTA